MGGIVDSSAHWHNSCCKEPPPICMLLVLSQSRQSCLSRFEQRGQVRGAMLLQTPHLIQCITNLNELFFTINLRKSYARSHLED